MNIIIVHQWFEQNATFKHIALFANEMAKRGHKVLLISHKDKGTPYNTIKEVLFEYRTCKIKVNKLEKGFYYDFPIAVYTTKNVNTSSAFQVKEIFGTIDLQTAEARANALEIQDMKPLSLLASTSPEASTIAHSCANKDMLPKDRHANNKKDLICLFTKLIS